MSESWSDLDARCSFTWRAPHLVAEFLKSLAFVHRDGEVASGQGLRRDRPVPRQVQELFGDARVRRTQKTNVV